MEKWCGMVLVFLNSSPTHPRGADLATQYRSSRIAPMSYSCCSASMRSMRPASAVIQFMSSASAPCSMSMTLTRYRSRLGPLSTTNISPTWSASPKFILNVVSMTLLPMTRPMCILLPLADSPSERR